MQRRAAAVLRSGSDAVIQAGTGSGKTLAYLLPVLARLSYPPETLPDDLQARVSGCACDAELQVAGNAPRHVRQASSKPAHVCLAFLLANSSKAHTWDVRLAHVGCMPHL